jgi:hypothetical protein
MTELDDPITVTAVCEMLESAIPVAVICKSLGVTRSTYYARRQQDAEFAHKTDQARATGIRTLIARVVEASEKDWRAAVALLRLMIPTTDWQNELPPQVKIESTVSHPPPTNWHA